MEYWKKKQLEAEHRLRTELDKPMPPHEDMVGCEEYFHPWDLFDGIISAYNGAIDVLAIDVLKAVRDRTTFDLLDDPHRGLAAEMFMHMLAVEYCDYGTSPRGIFPASSAIGEMLPELIDKWTAWYRINWGEDVAA